MFYLTRYSQIISATEERAVQMAISDLKRDMEMVLGNGERSGAISEAVLDIRLVRRPVPEECFTLMTKEDSPRPYLEIGADSHLGFIYGIYEVSRRFLGIHDFWFWMDQPVRKKERIPVAEDFAWQSRPFAVRLRGWFVNDEVLLHTWSLERDSGKPWQMVFETLLRCGGNMVIPGTDRNSVRNRKAASDRGLSITHHHAEPLGAELFARAYPEENPSYDENGALFRRLWREGIENQKDLRVVWSLGFRGQGDCPFWLNDPHYQTDESRGELISQLIGIQYQMVKEANPEAICCTNLYGEAMELYKKGHLQLPEDVIYIWADNGFGKMVSRRQNNHNPRVSALPPKGASGRHGIYYHVSFYDLQAANHMTMLPNPAAFVEKELGTVLEHGGTDYWIINCSNVKPHVFFLDLIARMWRDGAVREDWAAGFVADYFGEAQAEKIQAAYLEFADHALPYGPNEDDRAGEQFANHVPRMLMTQFMADRNQRAEELLWANDGDHLTDQVDWYESLCRRAVKSYQDYDLKCEKIRTELAGTGNHVEKILFDDSLGLQVKILLGSYQGALFVCQSLQAGFAGDYQKAFYYAGKAMETYTKTNGQMRQREHGKWSGFYHNECLTDIKQSAWVTETLMGYFRTLGDGPHFYHWQREFFYPEEDKRVMLILNFENHLTHQEIYELMKARWDQ